MTFGTLPNGFSVACVADGEYTISYEGVDKENQQTQAYEVATVVTVNDRNILSVARAQSDNIIIDQGPAEGTPPAPVITNPDGGSVIYFTPGTPDSNQAPALLYSAKIKRQDNAELTTETVTVDQDNMEIAVTGTTASVDYIVDVYGINEEGKGETASTSAFQLNYNSAEGSGSNYDYVEQDDWNGTGQKWAVHTYRASGTFTVKADVEPFHVLVVAGGGNGAGRWGNNAQGFVGGSGGSGGVIYTKDSDNHVTAPQGDYTITVGGQNQDSSAFGLTATKGGRGNQGGGSSGGSGGSSAWADGTKGPGAGTSYQGHSGEGGAFQGGRKRGGGAGPYEASTTFTNAGRVVDIRGLDETVAQFGHTSGTHSWGSGGWGEGYNADGKPGQTGAVVVAYQIGTSTTREIQQAEAESAARQAGVEEGLEQGTQEGYYQAQEELQEELTSLRTQLSAVGTTDV